MWIVLPRDYGYTAIENDGSLVQPQVGDFIIWWQNGWDCVSIFGHIAIVSRVMRTEIEVFEQNIQVDNPYRLLPMSPNPDRTWHLARGNYMGASYYVKGWLRYPGFNVVGRYSGGQVFHQEIKDCWLRENSYLDVGWAIDDGGGVFVHFWIIPDQPPLFLCQNFRRKDGQESIIMHGAPYTSQAHLISGLTWEYYRYGYIGTDEIRHYGPDIRLPNGKTLGCPMSDKANGIQYFGVSGQRTGYYKEGLKAFQPAKAAEGEPVKTSETYVPAVDLYQLDGALVGTYYLAGELSALILTAEPMSQNHNALAWLGGPFASSYRVLADGVEITTTPLKSWVETSLSPGTTRKYQVVALAGDGKELASSNEVITVTPGQAGSFLLQGAADGFDYIYLTWNNTLYPDAFYWVYRDGVRIAKMESRFSRWHEYPLEPSHGYTYQLAAATASDLVLGWSNEVSVTTGPAPPPPPLPDPVRIES